MDILIPDLTERQYLSKVQKDSFDLAALFSLIENSNGEFKIESFHH